MLAIAASRLSSSDTWRRKDEKTNKRSTSENWRDRRGLEESAKVKGCAETGETSQGSAEIREKLGNWRSRKQEKAKTVDEPGVYGHCMPAEWKLQKMYKQLKIDTNKFTTWLVESVYPCNESLTCSESLPQYITLSRKQAKGMSKPEWEGTINVILTTSTDHPKYNILVNNNTDIARQIEKVPSSVLALLDRLIIERTEYSHWMALKSTDDLSKISNDSHVYYIKVLKEVHTILLERMEPETKTSSQVESQIPAKTANAAPRTHKPTLGKRKNSSTSLQGSEQQKAVKTESATPTPKHVLQKEVNHLTTQQEQQQEEWRQVVADSCDKKTDKRCAPVAKSMSYAAALRVTVA